VGSGGLYSPGPATAPPPKRRRDRWMALSRHPEPCADPHPLLASELDTQPTFRPRHLPTVSPADLRSELGPRSLDPDRPFRSACAELIRGQRSPSDFCN
jgi:hypothetical protein